MKIFYLFTLCSVFASAQNFLNPVDDAYFLEDPVSFTIGQYGYSCLGLQNFAPRNYKHLVSYDPQQDNWNLPGTLADCPHPGSGGASGFSANGYGFVVGGFDEHVQTSALIYTNQLWRYDAAANTWNQKTSFPGPARSHATTFVIGSKAYYGLGRNGTTSYADFYEYDVPSDTWKSLTSLPAAARYGASGFALGDKGYVVAGVGVNTAETWEYDSFTDTWLQKGDLPSITWEHKYGEAFSLKGKGYYCFGFGANMRWGTVYEYHPASGWSILISHPQGADNDDPIFSEGTSFVVNDVAYLGMGHRYGGNITNKFWTLIITEPDPTALLETKTNDCQCAVTGPTVKIKGACKEGGTVRIMDLSGRTILHYTTGQRNEISLEELSAGLYILQSDFTGQETTSKKFVITE